MDSGNSGSLQSSSGGDDDFDAACGGGADSSTSSPFAVLLHQQGFGGGGGASSLIYGLQDLGAPPLSHWCSTTTAPLPPPAGAGASASPPATSLPCRGAPLATAASAPAADHAASATPEAKPAAPPRGSRKRARASRRAPTTVLTTDTSNFRAMVQEFTGIPAPPFAGGAASGARSRLDHLFPSRSSATSAFPQYLRPFAHNKQLHHAYPPPPFNSPSTSQPAPASAAIAAPTTAAVPGATAGDGYPHQLTTTAPSNSLLGMQDHGSSNYLSFQSSTLGAQVDGGDANANNKYPTFDHRGVAPPSPATRLQQDPADFLGLTHGVVMSSSEGSTHGAAHLHQRNGDELSGLVGGCKATYSSARPLLERNGPRRPAPAGASTETTTTATAAMRTQGVDSWLCSTSE
jgi:hypothetical protein